LWPDRRQIIELSLIGKERPLDQSNFTHIPTKLAKYKQRYHARYVSTDETTTPPCFFIFLSFELFTSKSRTDWDLRPKQARQKFFVKHRNGLAVYKKYWSMFWSSCILWYQEREDIPSEVMSGYCVCVFALPHNIPHWNVAHACQQHSQMDGHRIACLVDLQHTLTPFHPQRAVIKLHKYVGDFGVFCQALWVIGIEKCIFIFLSLHTFVKAH
jgi:hypothetical protein